MSATLTTISSIDRYILSSRNSVRWKYCTRPIAMRCLQFTVLFWVIIPIPLIFCYTRIHHSPHNGQLSCSNLHLLVMMIFGFLTCANVHHLRRRSSLKSVQIQHINYQLTSMVVLQSIKSSFSSLPFSIFNCYMKRKKI
jgi:hypothetical protein